MYSTMLAAYPHRTLSVTGSQLPVSPLGTAYLTVKRFSGHEAINELFDYGRPAAVGLAVLADRGGRELPVAATYGIWDVALDDGQSLVLERKDDAQLAWRLEHA